jgi:simple sugar transport system ATP-binding protein
VEGNGQSELIEALVGLRQADGKVLLGGQDVSRATLRQRRQIGLALIPEDRRRQGLNLLGSIAENIGATRYFQKRFSRLGVQNFAELDNTANTGIREYQIKAENAGTRVSTLSGGNAQKVIIARELADKPMLLVAAQPTRGLDVLSSQSVRKELVHMKMEGVGVLLLSADLDEILSVSDRILVIFEGQMVGELMPEDASYERLGLLMAGHLTPES